ncbi:hypothetical protein [Fontivita pretiosa]|uniref:hypothetical protein n=1 Tax=Fontivita pretiosa TaxID=2989684 RepID=UPI003D17A389
MPAKRTLLSSLMRLLDMVLPAAETDAPADEASLDPSMQLAVRAVNAWAEVNRVPIPRLWIVRCAHRCPAGGRARSEIHWAIKMLFAQVRQDLGKTLDEPFRFKLELAVATASRAWMLIESQDEDEEVDSAPVVGAYAVMFQPAPGTPT